jgi:hypothetical protein
MVLPPAATAAQRLWMLYPERVPAGGRVDQIVSTTGR